MKCYAFKPLLLLALVFIFSFQSGFAQNKYLSFSGKALKQTESTYSLPQRTVQITKANTVEIRYSFTGAFVSEKTVKSEKYNFIHIDGFSKMGQVGAPALPSRNEVVALPRGAEAQIKIINAEYIEFDGYFIYPALEPAVDTEGAKSPEFVRDETVFSKNAWFPQNNVKIGSVGLSRGTPLAVVQVTPVQFNPVTRKIRVCTNIEFSVIPKGGESNFDYISRENSIGYTNNLKRAVINSESIPDGISYTTPPAMPTESITPKNYIIITHSEYFDEAKRLANWKRQLGYSVEVVSRGSWTAEDVKTEVQARYAAWSPKPDYMLVIGDHNDAYAVPGEIHQDPSDGDDFATDSYFVCMDGSGDHIPDMAKGRISVSSLSEATIVIDKIINYEKTPPTSSSFYENVLNCAQYQDSDDNDGYADRRFCHTSEEIRDYLQNEQGYTSERVYYRETGAGTAVVDNLRYNNGYYSDGQLLPAELRLPTFNWNGGAGDITTAIDAGKFLVFHRDHGYVGGSGWAHPFYTASTMTNLSNSDLLPVVFSMNCHTGEFQLANCFAEKFMRMENKGAVGVVAAAYYSYSGYNDALSDGMIDAIWPDPGLYPDFGSNYDNGVNYTMGGTDGIYTMGDVVNQGLYSMTQNYLWNNTYTFELFHYFGDPAMKIWTANPNDNIIVATHDATIDCTQSTFAVSGSLPYATATLLCNNSLIGKTSLDATGNGNIPYTLTAPGDVTLTISKHNGVPYTSMLTQTCADYPPELSLVEATNMSKYSATIGGVILNDFGNTVTESGVIYGTSPDIDFGRPGVVQLQTSPVITNDSFSFDLTGLTENTNYYYMAYAINAIDTGYTDVGFFTTENDCVFEAFFAESFENGQVPPDCWTTIDNDGDGYGWIIGSSGGYTPFDGTYLAVSESWISGPGPLTPDNWLITPKIALTTDSATLKFAIKAQDDAWLEEKYSILISVTGNDIEDFTPIKTQTISTTGWDDITISLSGYAGDSVYFAFRHWDCTDWYQLVLDHIRIEEYGVPENHTVADVVVADGESDCFNATNTLTVAGDGSTVDLMSGSYTNFIAGQSIRFLPGFHAQTGSILNAWITTIGEFCNDLPAPIMAVEPLAGKSAGIEAPELKQGTLEQPNLKVYPNPNNGRFTIKLENIESETRVLMYSSVGQVVYDATMTEKLNSVELPNLQRGIYLIKAINQQKQFEQKMMIW
ncbi:MAG: C25 family cysteine peptidase [Prolixibacteraceae bacterium]|jgi:hypothetical protein|nr:C25 family cysteine peptidase [Prolixibacteraceae bacterium]